MAYGNKGKGGSNKGGKGGKGGKGRKGGKGGKGKGERNGRRDLGPAYDKFKEEIKSLPLAPESLSEEEVGINAYSNKSLGFSGVFRERFSDFLVYELSEENEVANLMSVKVPSGFDDMNGFREEISSFKKSRTENEISIETDNDEKKNINDITQQDNKEAAEKFTKEEDEDDEDEKRRINFLAECWLNVIEGVEKAFNDGEIGALARIAIETLKNDKEKTVRVLLPPSTDKTVRKTCHQLIKDHIGHLVDADTIDDPEATVEGTVEMEDDNKDNNNNVIVGKCIRIWWRPSAGTKRKKMMGVTNGEVPRDGRSNTWQSRAKHSWNDKCPPYLKFVLYKENMDTMAAVDRLAHLLRIRSSDIGFAGTKDKRACTSQWITLFKLPAGKVSSIVNDPFITSKGLEGRQLLVGNFQYTHKDLGLGDLKGNRFGITLRKLKQCNNDNILNDDSTTTSNSNNSNNNLNNTKESLSNQIQEACESIEKSGFINFFGIQRFGSGGINTSDIGLAILKNDYESVVNYLMSPRGGDKEESVLAKHIYNTTKDAKLALPAMPFYLKGEEAVLSGLAYGLSMKDSVRRIPHKLKLLFVHAYQSKLFNIAAGNRMKFGNEPIQGDLVLVDETSTIPTTVTTTTTAAAAAVAAEDNSDVNLNQEKHKRRGQKGKNVHVVTAEEASNKTFLIDQVVLPLPGFDVKYPQYKHHSPSESSLEFFDSLLAADGLTQADLKRNDEFSLSGDYRALLVKAGDLTWSLKEYENAEEVLLPSNADMIQQREYSTTTTMMSDDVIEKEVKGSELALCIEFNLPSSSYATVFLRELMKKPMNSSYHVSLGDSLKTVTADSAIDTDEQ